MSINLEVKEVDDEGQMELIEQTRSVLKQAEQQVEAVAKLRQVDRQRTRALGDLVLTMESRRQELQGKLKEAGILEEYDDDRVKSAAAGYGHMMHNVEYERPVTSASGKTSTSRERRRFGIVSSEFTCKTTPKPYLVIPTTI